MTNQECAKLLGFDPSVGFVKYARGRVSFSCGKPDEIRLLASRATQHGLKISAALKKAIS